MESEEEKQCDDLKNTEQLQVSSGQQESKSNMDSSKDKEISASDSSMIPKSAKNKDEKVENNNDQKVRTDETLSVNAVNEDEVTQEDCKQSKILENLPSTATSSMISLEATTSQDNTSVISNEDESRISSLEHDKAKRSMSKGQLNGDSGISMEKSGNSSDDDSNKCQNLASSLGNKKSIDKETADTDSAKFHKLKSKVKKRNYRSRKALHSESGDNVTDIPDDGQETNEGTSSSDNEENVDWLKRRDSTDLSNHSEDDEASDNDFDGEDKDDNDTDSDNKDTESDDKGTDSDDKDTDSDDTQGKYQYEKARRILLCLQKEKPKHRWMMVPEILRREIGNNSLFRRKFYGSLHAVERLELMYKLKDHEGCVNAINFNQKGNLLASGSDDLAVVIWDWAIGKKHMAFDSGHRGNLFQTKWLPLDVEHLIVTSARDGEVRLLDISHGTTRRLACHQDAAHKVAVHKDSPHMIMSAGEDAYVLFIDVRQDELTKLLVVNDKGKEVPLYTIHSNPLNSNEFCVGGHDYFVNVYDWRKLSKPLNTLYPQHVSYKKIQVTSAVYNYNGTEILASYNDEDIYLFDTADQTPGAFAHRYRGHRNSRTVKGVNFFGPKSEFIISGSDCGNIFVWEKNTEAIVQWMPGDEHGVVNCLEPHPHVPILATSGLDYDVKIWVPSCEQAPSMTGLETCVKENCKSPEPPITDTPGVIWESMFTIVFGSSGAFRRRTNHNTRTASDDEDENVDPDNDDSSNDGSDANDSQSQSTVTSDSQS